MKLVFLIRLLMSTVLTCASLFGGIQAYANNCDFLLSSSFQFQDLSQEELRMLKEYTSNLSYEVNVMLYQRGYDKLKTRAMSEFASRFDKEVVAHIDRLDQVLTKFPANPSIVFRGRRLLNQELQRYEVGSELQEAGFLSTSSRLDVAQHFVKPSAYVAKRPKDFPVVWIIKQKSGRNITRISSNADEFEIVIPRSTSFIVTAIEKVDILGESGYQIRMIEK